MRPSKKGWRGTVPANAAHPAVQQVCSVNTVRVSGHNRLQQARMSQPWVHSLAGRQWTLKHPVNLWGCSALSAEGNTQQTEHNDNCHVFQHQGRVSCNWTLPSWLNGTGGPSLWRPVSWGWGGKSIRGRKGCQLQISCDKVKLCWAMPHCTGGGVIESLESLITKDY